MVVGVRAPLDDLKGRESEMTANLPLESWGKGTIFFITVSNLATPVLMPILGLVIVLLSAYAHSPICEPSSRGAESAFERAAMKCQFANLGRPLSF
jgi:hypothetical protein